MIEEGYSVKYIHKHYGICSVMLECLWMRYQAEGVKALVKNFPSFIHKFENGVAEVSWQINPDGRYYMDEDGYGMTDDEEIEIYGFIDQNAKVVVKFKDIKKCYGELDKMRKEAEEIIKGSQSV